MTTPVKSTPLGPADAAAMAERYVQQHQARLDASNCHVFYLASFRNNMLKLLQSFYATPDWYKTNTADTQEVPGMGCLTYNIANPADSTLQVRGTLTESPASPGQAVVWVRVPMVNYEKSSLGDRGELDGNKADQRIVKLFKGRLMLQADHDNSDVAVSMLDHALTFLEGTKSRWTGKMGLQSFDVESLTDAVVLQPAPQRIVRSTLTCVFQGRLNITAHEEALTLKRVVSKVSPAS